MHLDQLAIGLLLINEKILIEQLHKTEGKGLNTIIR